MWVGVGSVALRRLGVLQLDSVNVFERSHYLPFFARLGPYRKADLDRLAFGRSSTEYWGHQASVIPVEHRPLFEWRMAHFRSEKSESGRWVRANPRMAEFLRAELRANGPLAAREIEHEANRRTGPWWGWSEVKTGLEALLMGGEVAAAGRRNFERRYALTEDAVPAEHLGRDIADYFRLAQAPTKVALAQLVADGELIPATVEGWAQPAWRHRDARVPRRIEIYTPEPQRVHGYYTLPVLMDDALVGRIDLKTDRQAGVLRVQSAWEEPGHRVDPGRLVLLLRETAAWQGMDGIEVVDRGDVSKTLAAELNTRAIPWSRDPDGTKVRSSAVESD